MNILFSSVSGSELTAHFHFSRVLGRLGHKVFFFSNPSREIDLAQGRWIEPGYPYEISFKDLAVLAGFQPDLFIYMEPDGIIPRGMESANFPTACIISDTHLWLEARQKQARFFDHVFLFHRNYVEKFSEHPNGYVHWMPYACDLEYFHPVSIEKDLDLAFIGKLGISLERQSLMAQLLKRYKVNPQRFYYQKEIPEVYSRAKIVLNLPLGDDLNYRTFEAMSCGSLLLTRRMDNGQDELFNEGVHFAAYSNHEEIFEKIDYFLANPDEREKIAQAGLEEIQRNHSLDDRLQKMLNWISENPELVAPVRKMDHCQVSHLYAWLYEYWRKPEAGYRLAREARQRKTPWLSLLPPAIRSTLRLLFR